MSTGSSASCPGGRRSFLAAEESCAWYEEGDQNTKFLHASTKQQRARNKIIGILNEVGVWTEKEEEIEQISTSYFNEIFYSSTISDLEISLQHIPSSVTAEMNDSLLREVSAAEVKSVVFAIHPEKTPDGSFLPKVLASYRTTSG